MAIHSCAHRGPIFLWRIFFFLRAPGKRHKLEIETPEFRGCVMLGQNSHNQLKKNLILSARKLLVPGVLLGHFFRAVYLRSRSTDQAKERLLVVYWGFSLDVTKIQT